MPSDAKTSISIFSPTHGYTLILPVLFYVKYLFTFTLIQIEQWHVPWEQHQLYFFQHI